MSLCHTIALADCLGSAGLATIADKFVDHVISDPPFSAYVDANSATMGKHVSGKVNGRAKQVNHRHDSLRVGTVDAESIDKIVAESCRVARGWLLFFCDFDESLAHYVAAGRRYGRWVRAMAWVKPDSTPQLTGDRPASWGECIALIHASKKGRMRWNGGGKRGVYTHMICRGAERSEHPTQKPLGLMRELIEDFTNEGEVILDPFCGSGSTLVAAKQLERSAIGIELNPDYHAIATRRIAGERAVLNEHQTELFNTGR